MFAHLLVLCQTSAYGLVWNTLNGTQFYQLAPPTTTRSSGHVRLVLVQAMAISWASPRPSSLRRWLGRGSSFNAQSKPPSTNRLRIRPTVGRLTSRASMICGSVKFLSALCYGYDFSYCFIKTIPHNFQKGQLLDELTDEAKRDWKSIPQEERDFDRAKAIFIRYY